MERVLRGYKLVRRVGYFDERHRLIKEKC